VVETTGRTAAEHGGARLVHALVELGGADVALLVVIVCGAGHYLGVWRIDRAAALASIRLDRDWAPRRFGASCDLVLRGRLVVASMRESACVIMMVVEGLSVGAMLLLQGLVRARTKGRGAHREQIVFWSCVQALLLHRLDDHVIG